MGTFPDDPLPAAPVTTVNAEQAQHWNGHDGEHWAANAERYDSFAAGYNRRLHEAARIGRRDHVLDVGCGAGGSTRDAARAAPGGLALGVDLSAPQLARARAASLAEGLTNAVFLQADAQVHRFDEGAFDVVTSRFGAMFFADPVAAFANLARALRPGGRLVLVTWQPLPANEWLTAMGAALAAGRTLPVPPVDVPGPFGLATPGVVRRILTAAGFADVSVEDAREPVRLGADTGDAFGFVTSLGPAQGLLQDLDGPRRARALEHLRSSLAAHETDAGVLFGSAAWLVTAHKSTEQGGAS